jgi:hypothetical protein
VEKSTKEEDFIWDFSRSNSHEEKGKVMKQITEVEKNRSRRKIHVQKPAERGGDGTAT